MWTGCCSWLPYCGFGVGIYTYNYLPVLDFLAYKVGANIPDEMKTPPGAMPD